MKDVTPAVIGVVILIAVILSIYLSISAWNECREMNSITYCLRLVIR